MVIFPNAKINIGLSITDKRADGYHNLATIFYPIPIKDVLEIIPADKTTLQALGLNIEGNQNDNLILKAYHLLAETYPDIIHPVKIFLQKNIPIGAGMGGGSADGAFMLRLLNDYFKLGLDVNSLKKHALQLGSDCPFFIDNVPSLGLGRGEILSPVNIDLSQYAIQTITPRLHIYTKDAFAHINPQPALTDLSTLDRIPITEWRDKVVNDFETTIFKTHPILADIKKQLYKSGALYASLSGTGATVYGIFPKSKKATINIDIDFDEFYFD